MKNIFIIGATSAIAEATARNYAKQGARLCLLARNESRLESMAKDLKIRGAADVETILLDVNHLEDHEEVTARAFQYLETIDAAIIAHGTLPDQKACEQDPKLFQKEMSTNALSTLSFLNALANRFEQQQRGTIAVITSVAGDRGRQSNYIYGAAKGMVSIFLQGLRNRLYPSGIYVLDIKPGFVDTPMTQDFDKGIIWAQPEYIAKSIIRAIQSKKDRIYTPFFWRYIMLLIRNIPEFLFKKLKF